MKRPLHPGSVSGAGTFSAALCRGLIEAAALHPVRRRAPRSFPRLYAAASLKLMQRDDGVGETVRFPRLYAAASLKRFTQAEERGVPGRFPRLYAAASLKRGEGIARLAGRAKFSAALCRGLIEASPHGRPARAQACGFPRLYAAASLKRRFRLRDCAPAGAFSAALCRGLIEAGRSRSPRPRPRRVFRGFMPRPH